MRSKIVITYTAGKMEWYLQQKNKILPGLFTMEEEPKVLDLNKDILEGSPEKGIWSQTFHKTKGMNAVIMRLAAGEDLTEHTSKYEAVIHALSGKATITLGENEVQATAGTWIHMPAKTSHSVTATEDFLMLLYIVK